MKRRLGIDYDHLFHIIPDHYLVINDDDPTFTIVDASDSYCALTDRERSVIIDQPMFSVFPESTNVAQANGANSLAGSFRKCISTAQPDYMGILRYDIQSDDGEFRTRYWETTNYPIKNNTGNVVGILHATDDVTAKVEDNEMFGLIKNQEDDDLSYGIIGSWQMLADRSTIILDSTTQKLFGIYQRACLMHVPLDECLDYIYNEDRLRVKKWFDVIKKNGEASEIEFRIQRETDEVWVNTRAKYVTKNGKEFYAGVIINITERKRAEQELADSEQRLTFMIDTMPQLAWTAEPDGKRDYFNVQWSQYTGVKTDALIGDGWLDVVYDGDRERVRDSWYLSIESGEIYEIEYRVRRSDGEYEWFMGRGVAYRDKRGKIRKWYGTLTNIHDKKVESEQLEELVAERTEQLLETNAGLARSNDELQNFAYVASHDLQEPLRKIQAFGDLLGSEYSEQLGEGRDYLERMKTAAARMSVLIEDLLAFSRITTKEKLAVLVDLDEVVKAVLIDLESQVEKTRGSVDVEELPRVRADPTHMRQLFQNLISNALKFHRDGVAPRVVIRATDDKTRHVITVADNGIGFDEKYADRIFSVFQRLHGRGEYEGTGIGLAVCRKIVERYGGSITATSKIGKGTVFRITLPKEDERYDN